MFRISTNRVQDMVRVAKGKNTLTLRVDIDPYAFVKDLKGAQDRLVAVENATDDTEPHVLQAARDFAAAIFGREQADDLIVFYGEHAGPVITICTQYLTKRLIQKVKKAQRAKR